jgi:hypothetical protein
LTFGNAAYRHRSSAFAAPRPAHVGNIAAELF